MSCEARPDDIVTEWDIVSRLIAAEKNPATATLGEITSKGLISVGPEETLGFMSSLMAAKGVRRVIVAENGEIAGLVTARNVPARLREYIDQITGQVVRFSVF